MIRGLDSGLSILGLSISGINTKNILQVTRNESELIGDGHSSDKFYIFIYGGFQKLGYTKKRGWFISWTIPSRNRWFRGTPMTQETSISCENQASWTGFNAVQKPTKPISTNFWSNFWNDPSDPAEANHHFLIETLDMIFAGWWLGHPSEKYESQLGWWDSQYMGK